MYITEWDYSKSTASGANNTMKEKLPPKNVGIEHLHLLYGHEI